MNIDEKALAALQESDTHAVPIDMTPEVKARFSHVGSLIEALLRRHTKGPLEAYSILRFVQHGFEEAYGIRGAIVIDKSDATKD